MREIKFRAWDRQHKNMVTYVKNLLLANQAVRNFKMDEFFTPVDDFEIMQYTGLNDKNGVEIFEGDIIAHEVNNMRGVVVWNPASYCYSIDSLDGSEYIADLCDYDWNPEVIGNIYENKELLK